MVPALWDRVFLLFGFCGYYPHGFISVDPQVLPNIVLFCSCLSDHLLECSYRLLMYTCVQSITYADGVDPQKRMFHIRKRKAKNWWNRTWKRKTNTIKYLLNQTHRTALRSMIPPPAVKYGTGSAQESSRKIVIGSSNDN